MTFANGVLLLMVALVVPAVVTTLLWKDRPSPSRKCSIGCDHR